MTGPNRKSESKTVKESSARSVGIDWDEVKQRLALAQQAQAASEQLSPERAKQVMDERAGALAHVPDQIPDSSEVLEIMTFPMGKEHFAIETRFVREVYRAGDITPLPDAPDFVVGLTNLRGEVMAVMNLRQMFHITAPAGEKRSQLVVLGKDRPEFGILVDDVFEVITVRLEDVLDPPGSVTGACREYLRGVTDSALLVLDGDALLNDDRLVIDEAD